MLYMKRVIQISILLLISLTVFAQSANEVIQRDADNKVNTGFRSRNEKGFFYMMNFSLMLGTGRLSDGTLETRTAVSPSFAVVNGYKFNEHLSAGAGVGFEIINHNLFPLFAEVRYSLKDSKISPFAAFKAGYSFADLKASYFDVLSLQWPPYTVSGASLRNCGGIMINPEAGVKVPLDGNTDLWFSVAYRFQKTRSVTRKEYGSGQFDEWEHSVSANRLSLGIAIMFR